MFDIDFDAGATTTLIGDAARRGRMRAESEALDPRTTLHHQLTQLRSTNAERGRNAGRCCGYLRLVGAWLNQAAMAASVSSCSPGVTNISTSANNTAATAAAAVPSAGLPPSTMPSAPHDRPRCCDHAASLLAVAEHVTATVDAVICCLQSQGARGSSSSSGGRSSSSLSSSSSAPGGSAVSGVVFFDSFEDAAAQLVPMCRLVTAAASLVDHCCSASNVAAAIPLNMRPAVDFLAQCVVDAVQGHLDAIAEAQAEAAALTPGNAASSSEGGVPAANFSAAAAARSLMPEQPADATAAAALFLRMVAEAAPEVATRLAQKNHAGTVPAGVAATDGAGKGASSSGASRTTTTTTHRATPQSRSDASTTAGASAEAGADGADVTSTTRGPRRVVAARRGGPRSADAPGGAAPLDW